MNNKFILLSIVGILASFIGGFLLANALNRNEMERLLADNTRLQKQEATVQNNQSELNLTDEEINKKIAEADENPKDFGFQKGLGLALYRYAGLKENTKLLEEVTRLLQRAYDLNPNDYQVITALGNIYYDLGQIKKDKESNLKARDFYAKALEKNEKDTNVLTDYGLTFLLTDSPDRTKAISELGKALEVNPKNERALLYMVQAQIELKNITEANKYLTMLKQVNPKNERISEFETQISQ